MRRALLLGLALLLPLVGAAAALGRADRSHPIVVFPDAVSSGVIRVPYHGGPVLHSSRIHLIFWQPAGSGLAFDPGYAELVERFETDVAADSRTTANEFGITGQFGDARGPAAYSVRFAGAVLDTQPLPPNGCAEPLLTGPPGWLDCLSDAQLQTEIERVVGAEHLPVGGGDVYFLLTPRGLGDCTDATSSSCALGGRQTGYCGYHSATRGGILYGVIPYNAVPGHCQSANPRPNASPADPALSTLSHEQAEVVTDPYGDAWIDSQGDEIADVCISSYGPALGGSGDRRWNEVIGGGRFWLQELLSRVTGDCAPRPQPDRLSLTWSVRGSAAVLSAAASVPGGRASAYRWSFGDGATGRGRRVRHRYRRPGRYRVSVRVTDSFGNYASASGRLSIRR